MLELFSGTKSMSHVASRIGFSTVTVDIDPATDPDICVDICDWHYASAGLGSFDFIHCSPPCEELSICKTNGERDIEGATAIANRMRTVIDYFRRLNPRALVTIENPSLSLLRHVDAVKGFIASETSYCAWGYPYQKNTKIFSNIPGLKLPTCRDGNCFWSAEGGHPHSVQHAPASMRRRMPACLCFDILSVVARSLGAQTAFRVPLGRCGGGIGGAATASCGAAAPALSGGNGGDALAGQQPMAKKRAQPSSDRCRRQGPRPCGDPPPPRAQVAREGSDKEGRDGDEGNGDNLLCSVCSTGSSRYGKWYGLRSKPRVLLCGRCYRRNRKARLRREARKPQRCVGGGKTVENAVATAEDSIFLSTAPLSERDDAQRDVPGSPASSLRRPGSPGDVEGAEQGENRARKPIP
jgi:hypothetical protein